MVLCTTTHPATGNHLEQLHVPAMQVRGFAEVYHCPPLQSMSMFPTLHTQVSSISGSSSEDDEDSHARRPRGVDELPRVTFRTQGMLSHAMILHRKTH